MHRISPLHDALAFFRLLMDCRSQIAEQLQEDEKIIKENVLLFDRNAGTITMKIHYTLLRGIRHDLKFEEENHDLCPVNGTSRARRKRLN